MDDKREFDTLTEGYLSYALEVRRLSKRTLVDMRCSYRHMVRYIHQGGLAKHLWQLEFEEWLDYIGAARNRGINARTLSKQLSQVRGLLNYAWRNNRIRANVLDGFNLKDNQTRNAPEVLSLAEAERLVQACPAKTAADRQARLVILLLYGCGLRTGEVAGLNKQDLDSERQELIIHRAKGDIERRVAVPAAVWTELLAYLAERGGKRGALFKTPVKKRRINSHIITGIAARARERAGLTKHVTPRMLRHSFATHLMDAGVDIGVISRLMGHSGPRETGIYLHALRRSKEQAVQTLNQLDPQENRS